MEEVLYLKDSFLKEFNAVVKESIDGRFIVLDQTAFYPSSGGQPNDTGIIIKGNEQFKVASCKKQDGKIVHEVDRPGLIVGDKIHGCIDWDRRYKLMRSHTAAHIISEVIHSSTNALITGNQLDLEYSRIDFSLDDYDPKKMEQYIFQANKIVADDLPISVQFMSREDAQKIPQVSKLAMGLPPSLTTVRILSIGTFDIQADGGTHVKSTKEVGKIELIKCENKGKNNRRLYFRLLDV